jgi:hypothetical protein
MSPSPGLKKRDRYDVLSIRSDRDQTQTVSVDAVPVTVEDSAEGFPLTAEDSNPVLGIVRDTVHKPYCPAQGDRFHCPGGVFSRGLRMC